MEKRRLGASDLKVSVICLGTMTWGQQNTQEEGHSQMDRALSAGVNFFDAAEMYPIPPQEGTKGRTEEIIGTWFAARKNRAKVILATKAAGRSPMTWLRDDGSPTRQTRAQLREAVEHSLKRLQTDYIDLYQLHWPDRPIQLFGRGGPEYRHLEGESCAIGEILHDLGELVQEGKIRHIGLSNETPWGAMRFLAEAEKNNLPKIVSVQNAYNLLNRSYEIGMAELFYREQVGLLAYSPLAQGYLTGKYQNGALPKGSRKELFNRLQRYETPYADAAIEAYLAVAKEHQLAPGQMAQAFVNQRKFVVSNIIGATSMEQLEGALASADSIWNEDLEKSLLAVHRQYPNPCP